MGNALKTRLERMEGAVDPRGLLPTILVAPVGAEGDAARQQAQRLRQQGHTVILVASDTDRLDGVVDWLEGLV